MEGLHATTIRPRPPSVATKVGLNIVGAASETIRILRITRVDTRDDRPGFRRRRCSQFAPVFGKAERVQFLTKDEHRSGYPHHCHVEPGDDADPEMKLENRPPQRKV